MLHADNALRQKDKYLFMELTFRSRNTPYNTGGLGGYTIFRFEVVNCVYFCEKWQKVSNKHGMEQTINIYFVCVDAVSTADYHQSAITNHRLISNTNVGNVTSTPSPKLTLTKNFSSKFPTTLVNK